jgi:hypothetical protein
MPQTSVSGQASGSFLDLVDSSMCEAAGEEVFGQL